MSVRLFNLLEEAASVAQRIERKYYVMPRQVGIAYGLLRQVCRPDDEYPAGLVNSLYFDSADLDEHQVSHSGDFGKDKVRIRWYGDDDCAGRTRTVFVELKSKQGFAGSKRRMKLEVPSRSLTMPQVAHGIIPRAVLMSALSSFGYFPPKMLYPIVKITYWRYRFVEPLTGQRVALDCRIRSTMVTAQSGNGQRKLELDGAVIEIKGASLEIPPTLRHMGALDVDWSQFSKYAACVDAHEERPGVVGRLSPSGRVIR